jgi:hypothetical protein
VIHPHGCPVHAVGNLGDLATHGLVGRADRDRHRLANGFDAVLAADRLDPRRALAARGDLRVQIAYHRLRIAHVPLDQAPERLVPDTAGVEPLV